MARGSTKRKTSKEIVEEAAEIAANQAIEVLDDVNDFEDDGIEVNFEPSEVSIDVFEEGFRKAIALKDSPRYFIKKNSQFLTVKDYPYSWEQLQKDYGPGWYQVQCKARSNGRILKGQTEMVGDPNEGRNVEADVEVTENHKNDDNLAILGWLQQSQERSDQRARETAKAAENNSAIMMQSMVQMMIENSKQTQAMMIEQSKQSNQMFMAFLQQNQTKGPDPVVNLLTTLLTQKPKDDGFNTATVLKMIQDAESRGEQRANKSFELIEKKSSELADMKFEASQSGGEENESLTKSLVKGFMPVLSQMVANQNQAQGQQMMRPVVPPPTLAQTQAYMEQQSLKPAISSNKPQAVRNPQPRPVAQAPVAPAPQPVEARPVQETVQTAPLTLNTEQKEMIFNFIGGDIGIHMMERSLASTAAEDVLSKLEKESIPRQTIASGFSLDDFYGFADRYIPAESLQEAKNWLKEFYEAIQRLAVSRTGRTKSDSETETRKPIPAKRGNSSSRGARAQSGETTKNI